MVEITEISDSGGFYILALSTLFYSDCIDKFIWKEME